MRVPGYQTERSGVQILTRIYICSLKSKGILQGLWACLTSAITVDDDTLTAIVRVSNDHGEKIKDIEQYMCSDDEVGVRVEGSYVSSTADRYSLRGRQETSGERRRSDGTNLGTPFHVI